MYYNLSKIKTKGIEMKSERETREIKSNELIVKFEKENVKE